MRRVLVITITLLLSVSFLHTVGAMVFDPADFSYVIHLYYDGNKFVPNTDSKFQYDVIGETFEQQEVVSETPYGGEVVSTKGEVLFSFVFDPKYVNSPVARGPLDVKAPYLANAKSITLYDDSGKILLMINVVETVACNENNICETDTGEDYSFCPSDCKAQIPITPIISETPLPTEGEGSMLWIILGAIALITVIIWLIIRRRRNSSLNSPSNTIPPPISGPPSNPV